MGPIITTKGLDESYSSCKSYFSREILHGSHRQSCHRHRCGRGGLRARGCPAPGPGSAAIVVSDIDEVGGRKTVGNIEAAGGRAAFFRADAGVEADVAALIDFAEKTFGGVDVIVNNASAPYHADEPMGHWVKTVQVDLLGPMFAILHGIEALRSAAAAPS